MGQTYYTGSLTPSSSGGGGTITVDSELSLSSENPVQNKVITGALGGKQDTLTAGTNITIEDNVISASGGTDPNEIPDGTVIEGTFSGIPAFIESLEGKYSNGDVIYKITGDETVTTAVPLGVSTVTVVNILIFVPKFNIRNVIIDCDNHTLTNAMADTSKNKITFLFLPFEYKQDFSTSTVNFNNFNPYNSLNQNITIKNGTITTPETNYNKTTGIVLRDNITLNINNCYIYSSSTSIGCFYGQIFVSDCTLTGKYYTRSDQGCLSTLLGTINSTNNSYTKYGWALSVTQGGSIRSVGDTFSDCGKKCGCSQGGVANVYSTNTSIGVEANSSNGLYGIVYNS